MKKFGSIFVGVLAVALIVLTTITVPQSVAVETTALQTSSAVQVPAEVNNLIGIGIAAMMTIGLLFIFNKTGLDLRQFASPVAITISAYVVAELQNTINSIPETCDPWLNLFFKILVLVLGSAGVLYTAIGRLRPVSMTA